MPEKAEKTIDTPASRLHEQLEALRQQVAAPVSVSRKQLVEALAALQESLQELDAAEAELAQQNDELLAAREELELERHRYRELFDLAPIAYLVTDGAGVVEEANLAAARLFGLSAHLFCGKPLPMLVANPDRAAFRGFLLELRKTTGVRELEVTLDGRRKPPRIVLFNAERTEEAPRNPVRLRWVLHDVTERRAAEEELRLSQERLRHAQRMEVVGRLAGGVAHSFNNLLAAIALHAELLLEASGLEEEQQRHAEEIQKAGERAAALARQLLAFGRKQVLQLQPLDISRQIAALVPMLQRLVGEHIELTTRLDADAGWIHGDLGQLEQVLLNLLVNARDAMPDGGWLRIETAAVEIAEDESLAPGSYVEITVTDSGIGMDEEVRAHLFEPFFTTKERDKGSGLGLATVYGIMRQSGGEVRVWSEPAKGARFSLYLPRMDRPAAADRPAATPREESAGHEVVLFVEDEENIREPAKEVLESRGYAVLVARNGADALRLAREWSGPLDLLVTDVIMPGMNGSQLAEMLCRERPGLRVLFISGYPEDAIARHGVLQSQQSFLQKPFPPGVLLRKVREVLDGRDECSAA